MNKVDAIKQFLLTEAPKLGKVNPLAHRYNEELEVQVNVEKAGGRLVVKETQGKKWHGYTDGTSLWKNFRIPWSAYEMPDFRDSPIKFNLGKYAKAIGLTGWNWKRRRSEWFGFDFDSILEHKEGLSGAQLDEILNKFKELSYATIFTSTSGNGFHIYISVRNSPSVENHTEHAALSRAVLNKLSILLNFEFTKSVDCCGGILWVWRRGAKGFDLIQKGTELDLDEGSWVPDWREHTAVCNRSPRQAKVVKNKTIWDNLFKSIKHVNLDDEHIKVMKWLEDNKKLWWWDNDHHMLVCHTYDLQTAHEKLHLRGYFRTTAEGKDSGYDQNCFAFPLPDGSWVVRRHSPGTTEHVSWQTDRSGWTYCYFNRIPDLIAAVHTVGGLEGKNDNYHFGSMRECREALALLEAELPLEPKFDDRPTDVKELSADKLLVTMEAEDTDKLEGWHKNKKRWEKVIKYQKPDDWNYDIDNIVRHLTAQMKEAGWYINTRNGWVEENKGNVVDTLLAANFKRPVISRLLGNAVIENWELVNLPFHTEYPGNRRWNKFAAQFAHEPREGIHPTWDMIMEHCSGSFNSAIPQNEWCNDYGIYSGYHYLLAWIASLFQYPLEPLPYLFLYGPQNSGKSSFHEALAILLRGNKGYARADVALTSRQHFNGEIEGAIICVVEEVNLQTSGAAYEKIKSWVTGKTITIHPKGRTPYEITNSTHWIQCANDASFCPVFPGDTRIVVGYVPALSSVVPKSRLMDQLYDEAPAFLHTVLNFKLGDPIDRLRLPVIITGEKQVQEEANRTVLQEFIDERLKPVEGAVIPFEEFYDTFLTTVPDHEKKYWSTKRVAISIPDSIPRGKMGQMNVTHLGNVSWHETTRPTTKLVRINGRLTPEDRRTH